MLEAITSCRAGATSLLPGYDDANMHSALADTDPAIERRQIDGLRQMSPARKFALVSALTRNVRQLSLAGIRLRHPGIDDREATLRLAALNLERAIMVRAFGWDPELVDS